MAHIPIEELVKMIDYAILRPDATEEMIVRGCEEAKRWHFAALCIHPCWLKIARENLKGSDVKLCTVVGFPLGANTTSAKIWEAKNAVSLGAEELDIVANLGLFKSGKEKEFLEEIESLVETCQSSSHNSYGGSIITKIIIECGYLTNEELKHIASLLLHSGADFLKTSTGFGPRNTTVEDVRTIRNVVGSSMRVKAAGGIRTLADVLCFLTAGADRIGTSSAVAIMEEYKRTAKTPE